MIGAMNELFETASEFQQFVDDFRNGGLKVEETIWAAEWGIVKTTTIYNCRTPQYIVTNQVLIYQPTGCNHADGVGRDSLFIEPRHAGVYEVTFFGTVR